MHELGKTIIVFGVILIGFGILLMLAGKVPHLGRLPGDILVQKKNFTFYFPLATSIIVSIVLTLVFWLINRFK